MGSKQRNYSVSNIDVNHMMYGNFIGVLYLFNERLHEATLRKAWSQLIEQLPILACVYDQYGQCLVPSAPAPFEASEADLTSKDFHSARRSELINEPGRRAVLGGRAPLSSLKLTELKDTGCVLGLAINHVITDAGGFHKVAQHLGDIYTALVDGKVVPAPSFILKLPEFTFGTDRTFAETKTELAQQGLKTPMSMRGVRGAVPKSAILWAMSKISGQTRLRVHFTPAQVQELKASAHTESGEDWISTNAALCAHFTSIMIGLIHDGEPKKPLRIGQLLDLRNRYFDDSKNQQNSFIGNAILIHTEQADLENYDRGTLTRFFKSMVSDLSPDFMQSRLDVIADSLRHGRNYPGLEMSDPLLAVNNQTKMPVYNIDFKEINPIDIIPQDVGDNIMFFPAQDGGVDIYIRDILNPKRQAKLKNPEWQTRIFDI